MTTRTAQFRIKEEHALAGARLIMKRKLKVPIGPFIILAIVIGLIGLALGSDGLMGHALPILSWLVLVLALILSAVQYWVLPRQTRRMYNQTSLLREQIALSWDENGFAIEGNSAKSRIAWQDLYAWDEEQNLFVLMQNEMLYNLVPKSALDEEQTVDLRNCLKASGLKQL